MKLHRTKVRLLSMLTTLAMLMSLFGAMPLTASAADTTPAIKLGDYVQIGKYGNRTLLWRCVAFEKVTGYDANGNPIIDSTQTSQTYKDGYLPLMLADKPLRDQKQFDVQGSATTGSHSRNSNRIEHGSNYWGDSNIRDWLNSSASKVNYSCGNKPSRYEAAGFLTNFSDMEKAAMQTVTQKSLLSEADKDISGASGDAVLKFAGNISNVVQNYSTARSEQVTDTMFFLDVRQVYNVYSNDASLGGTGYYKNTESNSSSSCYWLRTPVGTSSYYVRIVGTDGIVTSGSSGQEWHPVGGYYYDAVKYVRPAFFLNLSKALENPFVGLDGSGTKDEPYTVVHKHVLTYHAKVDATCTSSGTGEYWKCEGGDGCNKYFSDANGETQIYSPPYIRPKGHTWGEWTITKAPTETEKGEKVRECSVCHATETKEIAATNELNIGDYVEMGEYGGAKLLWRCVAFEKATRKADGSIEIDSTDTQTKYSAVGNNAGDTGYLPLMLADAAVGKTKAFDAEGANTSGSHGRGSGRTSYGSNYWGDANIRDWLNSADKTVAYTCGNAPSKYKDEAGFLTNFNSVEKAAMVSVKQKALINKWDYYDVTDKTGTGAHTINSSISSVVQNYSEAYATHITDTMFLLDVQQLYNVYSNLPSYCTISAEYWLRSPDSSADHLVRYVSSSSNAVYAAGVTYSKRIRPAFFFDLLAVEFEGGDGAKETPHTLPAPVHYHTLEYHYAVAPTCTESGTGEYWECTDCHMLFSDESGETEITQIPTIAAKGHAWGDWTITTEPTLTTTGTAERVCENDPNHTESVNLPVLTDITVWTKGDYTAPTETTDGSQVYTSQYGNVTLVLPATGPKKFSIRYEDGMAIAAAPTAGTYDVIFAAYDNGRLTGLSVKSAELIKGETVVVPVNFTANGTVKVMLWDRLAGMKPLCESDGN